MNLFSNISTEHSSPYQPIKFCLLSFLSEFGIVSEKAQPGSPGMVTESRKAAPALRARLLRSYVPLRRNPSGSVLSGTIPALPGGHFSTHNQNNPIINNIICIVNIKELSRYWSRIASNPAIITPGKFTSAPILVLSPQMYISNLTFSKCHLFSVFSIS